MDPITASTLLATLVQLIGLYRQEMGARKDLTHREFIEWLEVHRHEEIKELITHTFHLQSQVDDLLRQDHAEILSKLDHVNAIAMDILARIEGFEAVAAKLIPQSGLSDDALDLLKLFVQNGDHTMMPTPRRGLIMFSPSRKTVQYSDNRFVEDDFAALISHGLLMPDIEGNMTAYRLTRRAPKFVQLLPPSSDIHKSVKPGKPIPRQFDASLGQDD